MTRVPTIALRWLLVVACFVLAMNWPVAAHQDRPAVATLTLSPSRTAELEIRLDLEAVLTGITAAETAETSAAYKALRALEPGALRAAFERGSAALLSGFEVRFDGVAAPLALRSLDIPDVGDVSLPRISTVHLDVAVLRGAVSITCLPSVGLGNTVVRIVEMPGKHARFAGLLQGGQASPEVRMAMAEPQRLGLLNYVGLGFEHILPKGLDHILFVLGLFLLNPQLRPLIWQVSTFTVAHSVTLALGIYGILELPSSIVEPLIAASIVFIAVENLMTNKLHRWRPAVVFTFGLVHGLGFAGVLTEIGLPRQQFVSALLGFNLGVELGQIAVLACAFLTVGLWFRHRAWYRIAITNPASVAIAVIGAYWFIERVA